VLSHFSCRDLFTGNQSLDKYILTREQIEKRKKFINFFNEIFCLEKGGKQRSVVARDHENIFLFSGFVAGSRRANWC